MSRAQRILIGIGSALLLLALALAAAVAWLDRRGDAPAGPASLVTVPATPQQIEHGRYLAQLGNCAGCHTAVGASAFAGGRALPTPFGTVYSSNLTPDAATGIGGWSADAFWGAMHHGRSKDGRRLNPVFPYPSYTHIRRADSDALHAYLHSLPPVAQPNRPHALRFPYGSQAGLAVWRALYFRPGAPPADPARSAGWNRGAYLARGLGHCIQCHSTRDALGGIDDALALGGGRIPSQGWYAPSLTAVDEAGVAGWERRHVVQLLKTGQAPGASTTGPMAAVVFGSTQHWRDDDLLAVAEFLQSLPQSPAEQRPPPAPAAPAASAASVALVHGGRLYEQHCAQCHGPGGQGAAGAYPALAGNRAVRMAQVDNLVAMVRGGGYAPATAGNPRPYGMPPFAHVLDDADTAAVLSYIRQSWGNGAGAVTALDVLQATSGR